MKKVFILFLIAFLVSINVNAQLVHKKTHIERTKSPGLVNSTQSLNKTSILSHRMEIVKKLIAQHKTGIKANKPLSRLPNNNTSSANLSKPKDFVGDFIPYTAYGFEDGYLANTYHRGFPLNQLVPMANAYPPFFIHLNEYYFYGGTTANWGLGLVSGWDDWDEEFFIGATYRGAYFIDRVIDPYWNKSPNGEYWPVDLAFDHTTNTLYILYFYLDYDYFIDPDDDPGNHLAKPNIDLAGGFYLAKFALSVLTGMYPTKAEDTNIKSNSPEIIWGAINLTEIPSPGSAIPLFTTNKDPWDFDNPWEHLYMGLACSRTGQLYTMDYGANPDDEIANFCSINKTNGNVTILGQSGIEFCCDFDDYWYAYEFFNLEFDHATNKLWGIKATDWTYYFDFEYYSDLYELNPATGQETPAWEAPGAYEDLFTDPLEPAPGLAKPDDLGVNYNHFVTAFQIPVCGVFLAAPNPQSLFFAGETSSAKAGENYDIKWFAYNVGNRVKLEYSSDNGNYWYPIADQVWTNEIPGYIQSYSDLVNPNSFTWNVPSGLSGKVKIKVSKASDPFFWDANDLEVTGSVSNNRGRLVILTPNGGEQLVGGTYYYITWKKINGLVTGSFSLEYSTDNGQTWTRINTAPIAGITRYSWHVPKINTAKCKVRIINYLSKYQYDISDNYFSIVSSSSAKNYPNPFNPSTKIVFNLEKSEFTSLKVFNSIGQEVAVLVNKQLESGAHEFEFNAANLPSGVYFYNLSRGDKSEIHKMMLVK